MPRAFDELVELGEAGLRDLWRGGTSPEPDELAGWIFRGVNTSLPARRSPLAGAGFAKGFFWVGAVLYGCNFPVSVEDGEWQVDLDQPFGFFHVRPTAVSSAWRNFPTALLFDYGHGRSAEFRARWAVSLRPLLRLADRLAWPLRDLLVRPPDAVDGLYVGRAFVTSTLRLPVTCFVIERWKPIVAGSDQLAGWVNRLAGWEAP